MLIYPNKSISLSLLIGSVVQNCYSDHLPVIGLTATGPAAHESGVFVGDKVEVRVTETGYRMLQLGHGGINDEMIKVRIVNYI